MFHIVLLGYVYVVLLFSLAQESLARGIIYFFCFAGFPVLLVLWARGQRARNRLAKSGEKDQEKESISQASESKIDEA